MGFRFEVRDREGRSEGRGEVVDFDGPVGVGLEYLGVIDVGDLGKEVLGFAGLSGEWGGVEPEGGDVELEVIWGDVDPVVFETREVGGNWFLDFKGDVSGRWCWHVRI